MTVTTLSWHPSGQFLLSTAYGLETLLPTLEGYDILKADNLRYLNNEVLPNFERIWELKQAANNHNPQDRFKLDFSQGMPPADKLPRNLRQELLGNPKALLSKKAEGLDIVLPPDLDLAAYQKEIVAANQADEHKKSAETKAALQFLKKQQQKEARAEQEARDAKLERDAARKHYRLEHDFHGGNGELRPCSSDISKRPNFISVEQIISGLQADKATLIISLGDAQHFKFPRKLGEFLAPHLEKNDAIADLIVAHQDIKNLLIEKFGSKEQSLSPNASLPLYEMGLDPESKRLLPAEITDLNPEFIRVDNMIKLLKEGRASLEITEADLEDKRFPTGLGQFAAAQIRNGTKVAQNIIADEETKAALLEKFSKQTHRVGGASAGAYKSNSHVQGA